MNTIAHLLPSSPPKASRRQPTSVTLCLASPTDITSSARNDVRRPGPALQGQHRLKGHLSSVLSQQRTNGLTHVLQVRRTQNGHDHSQLVPHCLRDKRQGQLRGEGRSPVRVLQYGPGRRHPLPLTAQNSKTMDMQLLSYPLEELNLMLFEDKFLKELGDPLITYYFGPEKKMDRKIILEDASEQSMPEEPMRAGSLYDPKASDLAEMQGRIKQMVEQEKIKKSKPELPPIFKKDQIAFNSQAPRLQKMLENENKFKKSGSMSLVQLKKIRKSCRLKSNITSVAKRYATYLFTSCNLDRDKDLFSKRQFCDLLKAHPSIFDVYLAGFHTYVWQANSFGKPEYCSIQAEVEGRGTLKEGDFSFPFYFKLIKSTMFAFEEPESISAKKIINLQGLIIEFEEATEPVVVKFSHRDKLYPEKRITFEVKQKQWLDVLADFKESSILADYIKLERIGKGNFSNVYRCQHKKTGQMGAMKVIQPSKLTQPEREVLKRQIGILKQCHHPNIVKFLHQYKTHTHIYIFTELLSDGDLFEYTRKKSFLEEYEAAVIFRQLTEAILHLNELGIIHRDLKPENIMIVMAQDKKSVRRVKIIDFGFGVYKDQLRDLSQDQKYAGTPGFIAPQVYEMRDFDQKIDTFSLGIILYFMLYGYLPFQANYLEQIRELTLACNISLRNDHWSNVTEEAKDLVYKVLTFSDRRISTRQILEHPWLKNIQRLKECQGRNKKRIRILD